jgi:hypothetical protein
MGRQQGGAVSINTSGQGQELKTQGHTLNIDALLLLCVREQGLIFRFQFHNSISNNLISNLNSGSAQKQEK